MEVIKVSDVEPQVATSNVIRGKVTSQSIINEGNDELAIGLVNFSKGTVREFGAHAFDQVLYVTEGSGIIETETEKVTVTPGTFIFIPAGETHRHGSTEDSAFSHITIKSA